MKFIILALGLAFSFNSMAEAVKATGTTPSGEECTYTIDKMDSWEGQIVMFFNGPTGNFRAEFKTDELLNKGELVPQQGGVTLSYLDDGFVYTILKTEENDKDAVITVHFKDLNLATPASIEATALGETYNCTF